MGFTLTVFYNMTWLEFFIFKKGHEFNEWEKLLKFRLNYLLQFNCNVKKEDQLELKDFYPHSLDKKYLTNPDGEKITLREAILIAQNNGKGDHVGRLGT